jgi:8-amino-7-oxononanoate synthase
MYPDDFLEKKLDERRQNDSLRTLRWIDGAIDFCSNDYLGIVTNSRLQTPDSRLSPGSTGSRLLSGNYPLIEEAEKMLAGFHAAETALIFNSGYDANIGLLSSVPQKGDTILYDQLSHASIRDGIRLSFANHFSFAHNDLADLEKKMQHVTGTVFIVTESVFSMDGDFCPLEHMTVLAKKYRAHLIIDEAHATGVIGEKGEGLVQQLHLAHEIFARVHTFGKACGCHGAVVLGSQTLKDYLVNFARSFVFSTALPEHAVAMVMEAYDQFPIMMAERAHLQELIQQFQEAELPFEKMVSHTPIQAVVVPGNTAAKNLASRLQENGIDVRPILYPTVPKGKERLRIVLHAFNTEADLEKLIRFLSQE